MWVSVESLLRMFSFVANIFANISSSVGLPPLSPSIHRENEQVFIFHETANTRHGVNRVSPGRWREQHEKVGGKRKQRPKNLSWSEESTSKWSSFIFQVEHRPTKGSSRLLSESEWKTGSSFSSPKVLWKFVSGSREMKHHVMWEDEKRIERRESWRRCKCNVFFTPFFFDLLQQHALSSSFACHRLLPTSGSSAADDLSHSFILYLKLEATHRFRLLRCHYLISDDSSLVLFQPRVLHLFLFDPIPPSSWSSGLFLFDSGDSSTLYAPQTNLKLMKKPDLRKMNSGSLSYLPERNAIFSLLFGSGSQPSCWL